MGALELGEEQEHHRDHDRGGHRLGPRRQEERDRDDEVQDDLADEVEGGQDRVPGVEQPRAGKGEGERRRQTRRLEPGPAVRTLVGALRRRRAALRAVPQRNRTRGVDVPGHQLLDDLRQQQLEELAIAPLLDLPLLGASFGWFEGQRAELELQVLHLSPGIGAGAGVGTIRLAQHDLDHAPVSQHQGRAEEIDVPHAKPEDIEEPRVVNHRCDVEHRFVRVEHPIERRPNGLPEPLAGVELARREVALLTGKEPDRPRDRRELLVQGTEERRIPDLSAVQFHPNTPRTQPVPAQSEGEAGSHSSVSRGHALRRGQHQGIDTTVTFGRRPADRRHASTSCLLTSRR